LASTPRKEDKPIRPASRTADATSRGIGAAEPASSPPKLSSEWLASMLLDVTAHLMNAIDRASRLGDPLERIAIATEAGADAIEAEEARRAIAAHRRRRRIIGAAMVLVVAIAILVPVARYTGLRSRLHSEVFSGQTAAGAHLFVLGGARYEVTPAQFEERLKKIDPEAIHKYWVEIDGKRFPVKQAVGVGLGAERATFSTSQAISILRKLGYSPQETPS
jgi:hypothetical protein